MIKNASDLFYAVQICMGVSAISFSIGYLFRIKNNLVHRILGTTGVLLNLTGDVILVWNVYSAGIHMISQYPSYLLTIHRVVALLITVLMFYQMYTGIRHEREKHMRFRWYFLIGYWLVYISGNILFQGQV